MEPAVEKRSIRSTAIAWGVSLAIIAAAVWYALVGVHRHRLEFRVNGQVVRLTSRQSTFEVSTPGRSAEGVEHVIGIRDDAAFSAFGVNRPIRDDIVSPRNIRGRGYICTSQEIHVDAADVAIAFSINGRPFTLTATELRCGDRVWPLSVASAVVVDLDAER